MLKQVTIECDVPDGYEAVRFGMPRIGDRYISNPDGEVSTAERDFPMTRCLIVRPIPPQMVPLGPEDVVPGSAIRNKCWKPGYYELITPSTCGKGVYRMPSSNPTFDVLGFEHMTQADWSYKTPSMPDWQPCSKPAP